MSTPSASVSRGRWAVVLGWALVALQLANLARHTTLVADTGRAPGWDLGIYRLAASVVAGGGSPYAPGAIPGRLPYTYSPLLNPILPAFLGDPERVRMGYSAAALLSLVLAVIVLIRGLRLSEWRAAAAAWLVVGGGMSGLNLDFQAGNVTAFEMLPATVVLVGVLRRHPLAIGVGMALLCLAKPTWLVLALLPLLLDPDRAGLKRAVIAGVAGLLPLIASFLLAPSETRTWLGNASHLRESFNVNPCLRELIGDVFKVLHLPGSDVVWLAFAVASVIGLFQFRRTLPPHLVPGIVAAFALFAPLFFPRLKPYSAAIPGMMLAVLLTYDRRALRELALPIALVSFPYLVSYDQDTLAFLQRMNDRHLPIGGWTMVLSLVAGWLVVRWLRRERNLSVPDPAS